MDRDAIAGRLAELWVRLIVRLFYLSALGFWLLLFALWLFRAHPAGSVTVRWEAPAAPARP